MRYKAILFDVGDTLAEFTPNWAHIYGGRVRALGFDVDAELARTISDAAYRSYGEQLLREQGGAPEATHEEKARMRDEAALGCVACPPEFKDVYLSRMAETPVPAQTLSVIPGVFETLDYLKTRYRLGIVSNFHRQLADWLKEQGLSDYFEIIVISEIVGVEKPDIRIMQIALAELGLPPGECLYVGDQPTDVLCAKRAGLSCAWVARPDAALGDAIPYREDYRVCHVRDLMRLL